MVTHPAIDHKVAIELDSLGFALSDLPVVAAEWDQLDEGERASWSQDWDQLMGAVEVVLEPRLCSGTLGAKDRGRYLDLRRVLMEALPILDHLQLSRPRIDLTL